MYFLWKGSARFRDKLAAQTDIARPCVTEPVTVPETIHYKMDGSDSTSVRLHVSPNFRLGKTPRRLGIPPRNAGKVHESCPCRRVDSKTNISSLPKKALIAGFPGAQIHNTDPTVLRK